MAAKPRSEWTPAYRRRVESAERRGLSKQAARGHRPHEHVTRAQRAREAGKLTESDKHWLKRQQNRIAYGTANEAGKQRWAEAVAAFTARTPEEREEIRAQQQQREKYPSYATNYPPHYLDPLAPLYLSSRSGLR